VPAPAGRGELAGVADHTLTKSHARGAGWPTRRVGAPCRNSGLEERAHGVPQHQHGARPDASIRGTRQRSQTAKQPGKLSPSRLFGHDGIEANRASSPTPSLLLPCGAVRCAGEAPLAVRSDVTCTFERSLRLTRKLLCQHTRFSVRCLLFFRRSASQRRYSPLERTSYGMDFPGSKSSRSQRTKFRA
jgi:hypothetical protein